MRILGAILSLIFCAYPSIFCTSAFAVERDRTIGQYAHTAWGPKEGAPTVVTALAQSTDGYLWLGSPDGLYRFDGVTFERYELRSVGPFPSRYVSSLLALPNGDLWIGFRFGGICLLRNRDATTHIVHQGVVDGRIVGLAQDREGTMWAATGSGLARLEGNRWEEVGKEWNFPGKTANAVFLDRQGTLWVSTGDTLVFLPPGARRFQLTGIAIGQVFQIAQAPSGKLWMAETTRSVRPLPLSDGRLPPDQTEILVGSGRILFDSDGSLWVTTVGDGLRRAPAPELLKGKIKEFSSEVESFTAKDGLSDDFVRAILQDREGNIWVGTNNGLDRFRKTNLVPVALPFKAPYYNVLAPGDAGDAWVANYGAMARIHRGRADPSRHPFPELALSAYRDPTGTIWWLCSGAIYRYSAGGYARLALPQSFPKPYSNTGVAAIEDGSGAFWLAAEGQGLFYREGRTWKRSDTPPELAKLFPYASFTDSTGRVWLGYEEGTIIILKNETIQRVFLRGDSPVGGVRAIGGRGRHIWVGGALGLAIFDGNRFRRIIPADDETFGLVLGVEESSDGGLWMAESRGVIQVPASEVQQALDNSSYRVKYRIFDSFDGLPGTFVANSQMIQGTDGKLWFTASGGVAWIDPANISTNAFPPPVSIRSVRANDRQPGSLENLVLPPRTANLQIDYTALSLSVPEKVRFRYKLEGVDKDWQDAGTRREAFYTRLGPGKYHFQVIACNNDGVWNKEGAHLDFRIAPTWYQTNWFVVACVGAFLALLWALYQFRLQQLEKQFQLRMDGAVHERTRIARELHDTLLQGLHGLMFEFQAARNMFQKRPAEALQALDDALMGTERAITESQDAIENLRSIAAAEDSLEQLIKTAGEDLAASQGADDDSPTFGLIVEGQQHALNPVIREEVYRIARELLRNAFRHAQARRIEAEILYDADQFRFRVRDDGRGIDPQVLKEGSRPGHWGLPGVRERAQKIGAKLEIWSESAAGTEIQLAVAASAAYQKNHSRSRLKLFRRNDSHEHQP